MCRSGRGRFLEKRKTTFKRLSQRAGDTIFFANVSILPLVRKNVKFLFRFTWMLWYSRKKHYDGIREPVGFATGLLFSQTRQIDGNTGKNKDLEGRFVPVYTQ